ncbi:MAG TPA: hypothetical protein VF173_28710 [Thermoanaerobaculia bacterium]|nr:hypothetical protein [Thermoanaerobaculia bacterium]
MKRLTICLASFLLIAVLAPRLGAEVTTPAQPALATLLAAGGSCAATLPTAQPGASVAPAAPSDLFLPAPVPAMPVGGCTVRECISECSDCPSGHTSYCISTETCTCGCR